MRFTIDRPYAGENLAEFLVRSPHAYARHELLTWFSRRALELAIQSGAAARLSPGVFAATMHRSSAVVRGEAVNLRWPRAWVSGELALHLYAPQLPIPDHDDVIVAATSGLARVANVRPRQIGPLRAYCEARGVRCAPPAVAVLDAWHRAGPARREDVLYRALWARVCSWKQLRAELSRAARVAGRAALVEILGWFERGAHSPLEVRALRDVFAGPEFAAFERQVEMVLGERRIRADMLHRAARVIVELDGAAHHGDYIATQADHRRDADLAAAGFLTVRCGWADIVKRPDWCRRTVLAAVESRIP